VTLRIKLGAFTVEGDNEDELRAAMRVVEGTKPDSTPGPSGPDLPVPTRDGLIKVETPPRAGEITVVGTVPESVRASAREYVNARSGNGATGNLLALAPSPPTMVPVRRVLLDVLDVLLTFPEGITGKGIAQLAGVNASVISHRLTRLKRQGLAEGIPGTINWRATTLARKAKLVSS
jgi:hypothetical protein